MVLACENPMLTLLKTRVRKPVPNLSFLRACKAIYEEGSPTFYGSNAFLFHAYRAPFSTNPIQRGSEADGIRKHQICQMRQIELLIHDMSDDASGAPLHFHSFVGHEEEIQCTDIVCVAQCASTSKVDHAVSANRRLLGGCQNNCGRA